MLEVFSQLKTNGESEVDKWIADRYGEGLHFECKCKADSKNPKLAKDDRKTLGKLLSVFANSEGGVLIWGVEAREVEGVDCVVGKQPISQIDIFKSQVENSVAELISPPILGLEFLVIRSSVRKDSGYLAISVPRRR